MRGIFISKPRDGRRFAASRSRKGLRAFVWTEVRPDLTSDVIEPADVPRDIRRRAYRQLAKVAS